LKLFVKVIDYYDNSELILGNIKYTEFNYDRLQKLISLVWKC